MSVIAVNNTIIIIITVRSSPSYPTRANPRPADRDGRSPSPALSRRLPCATRGNNVAPHRHRCVGPGGGHSPTEVTANKQRTSKQKQGDKKRPRKHTTNQRCNPRLLHEHLNPPPKISETPHPMISLALLSSPSSVAFPALDRSEAKGVEGAQKHAMVRPRRSGSIANFRANVARGVFAERLACERVSPVKVGWMWSGYLPPQGIRSRTFADRQGADHG
jgi:hypothetical protein